jgi:hypothetical protein
MFDMTNWVQKKRIVTLLKNDVVWNFEPILVKEKESILKGIGFEIYLFICCKLVIWFILTYFPSALSLFYIYIYL